MKIYIKKDENKIKTRNMNRCARYLIKQMLSILDVKGLSGAGHVISLLIDDSGEPIAGPKKNVKKSKYW